MLYLNWAFTVIALVVAPALFFVVYHYTHRIKTRRGLCGGRKVKLFPSSRKSFVHSGG